MEKEFKVANLSEKWKEQLRAVEKMWSMELGKPIVLVAYEPEPLLQSPAIPDGYVDARKPRV